MEARPPKGDWCKFDHVYIKTTTLTQKWTNKVKEKTFEIVRIWKQKQFCKKTKHSDENGPPQAKNFFGFAKSFSKFAKGIYETFDRNLLNLAIFIVVVVFSTVQFIFFYVLLAVISEEP